MNFSGIIVGAAVFFSIGLCHPAVIKMEYYFGKKSWWVWLAVGLACCVLSMLVKNQTVSTIIGGFAFSCLWGIHEMFLQEKRVLRGSQTELLSRLQAATLTYLLCISSDMVS